MDEKQILRDDFILQGPSNPIELHELIFVIPQHNISYLEELLLQRSNPLDPLYQEWYIIIDKITYILLYIGLSISYIYFNFII